LQEFRSYRMIKYPAPLAFDSTFAFWRSFLPPELLQLPGRASRCRLAPPQSRTSPIKAYGSSGWDFAAQMEWTFPRCLAPSGSASSAICNCFVGTPIFGSVSALLVCPTHSFLSPTSPFPTRWLPRVGSPLFLRYYEDAKTSGCSSPRSSFSCERRLPP
jgi:hypothetical protein